MTFKDPESPSTTASDVSGRWRSAVERTITVFRRFLSSHLFRTSGVYVFANVANRAIPFLLLPILTRYLSPEDYGIVAMYTVGAGIIAPLVSISTDVAIGRQYFERDRIDFANYVTNCLYIAGTATLGVATLVGIFGRPLARVLAIPIPWVWTLVPLGSARFLGKAALAIWQMQQRAKQYGAFLLVQTLLTFSLSVALIVGLDFDWRGRILGEIISICVTGCVALFLLYRQGWIKHGINRQHLTHALSFGGGLIPHIYGALLFASTDRVFITNMIGVGKTGLYSVGAQIATIITVLTHSFNQAWSPWLFANLKEGDPERLSRIPRLIRSYNVVIVVLALALAAIAPWFLGFFVGEEFGGAAPFVLWLALGAAFEGMYKMVVNQIYYANKTHILAVITLGTGLVNVVLNYAMIRWNGVVGAAQATAISMLLSYIWTARTSARVEPRIAGHFLFR